MSIYNVNGEEIIVSGGSIYNYDKFSGKKLVVDGNSLTTSINWARYTADLLSMTLTNLARGGGGIVENAGDTMADIQTYVGSTFPSEADVIILQGDTNVIRNGNASDQMDGSSPQTTWTAKMNYLLRCLRAKYPNVLIVMTPDSIRYNSAFKTGNSSNPYDITLNVDNRNAMKSVADYNSLCFWEYDWSTPFNPNHLDNYYSKAGDPTYPSDSQDYVHPSPNSFARAKGRACAHFMAGLVYDPAAPNGTAENWTSYI